jgi:hypothetical protein
MRTAGEIVTPLGETHLQNDLQTLAALIKERESSLLLLLEEKRSRVWERPEWLMRECEQQAKEDRLEREIRGVVLRWALLDGEQGKELLSRCIRQFWVKVKMVMKMSLERIKLLDMLSYPLFERYEAIIESINYGYDRALGLCHYRDI